MKSESSTIKEILPTLRPKVIYEVILTTKSRQGEINAAPIGLRFIDQMLSSLLLIVYKGTKTYNNLLDTRVGVVNVTRDPSVFIKYLAGSKHEHLKEEIEDAELVDAPRLKNAEAYIEFKVENFSEEVKKGYFYCTIVKAYKGIGIIEPYSRGSFALIELAVNVSKIDPYLDQGIDVSELLQGIVYCIKVLEKTIGETLMEEQVKALFSSLSDRSFSLLRQHLSQLGIHL